MEQRIDDPSPIPWRDRRRDDLVGLHIPGKNKLPSQRRELLKTACVSTEKHSASCHGGDGWARTTDLRIMNDCSETVIARLSCPSGLWENVYHASLEAPTF